MMDCDIVYGYKAGLIGRVAQLHGEYYDKYWNFTQYFEGKVACEMAFFMNSYDKSKDITISVYTKNILQGSITIQSNPTNEKEAQLRWFIVSEEFQGQGIGDYLMKEAMHFCEQCHYSYIYLWTFQGLDSAKKLYEKYGFSIKHSQEGNQWGTTVQEVCYEIDTMTKKTIKKEI